MGSDTRCRRKLWGRTVTSRQNRDVEGCAAAQPVEARLHEAVCGVGQDDLVEELMVPSVHGASHGVLFCLWVDAGPAAAGATSATILHLLCGWASHEAAPPNSTSPSHLYNSLHELGSTSSGTANLLLHRCFHKSSSRAAFLCITRPCQHTG